MSSLVARWPVVREVLTGASGRPFATWPPAAYVPTDRASMFRSARGCWDFARDAGRRALHARAQGRPSCARMWGRIAARDLAFARWYLELGRAA